ncbi:serine hydrolase domain-containing protein [Paenibacillus sp. GSMTC-2017]|uniref:serine hydrolase domain-containing protein n=1 Tax=Paenibacillus sp. GSMTC-2017 TaxID=2794350 RepID=UPI001E29361E|nr:serine hydrolase domain-containing protein [Paenibacillus sp. GSMTC-2017]
MLVPTTAMAAGNSNSSSYEVTKKSAAEKAKLLTETYGNTSVQYALIDNGEIVISGHAGRNDLKNKIPLSSETVYGIGSTSKVVLTAAVMKLVDEGKIDLDKPLVNYISEFKMKDERYKKITPRMLLNHSSGLLGISPRNAALFDDNDTYTHDTLLEQLATQNLKADPGAYSVYCNDGYTLAEILVERVSGISFTAFITKFFIEPLEMNNTNTPMDDIDSSKLAAVYHPAYNDQLPSEVYNIIASGGIYSTAEDVVKFSQIFTGEVDDIISNKSVTAMEQAEYKKGMWSPEADTTFSYGLGWDSVNLFPFNDYGIKAVTKGGDTMSYHSSLVVLPEHNMAAAVLSSGGSSATDQLLANELLLGVLQEKGVIKERKPEKSFGLPVAATMPEEVTQFGGIYGGAGSIAKAEISNSGELSLSLIGAPNYPVEKLTYTEDGTFVNTEGTSKVKFVVEKNGRTYMWTRVYIPIPGLGTVAMSEYNFEKLDKNELSKDVAAAWEKRDGKNYYLLNEKYTSMSYFISAPIQSIKLEKEAPGYWINQKIVGANKAINQLQIPNMAGRDTIEYDFYSENGVEYVKALGHIYASEGAVKPLHTGKRSKTTIAADGYAKWYSVPAAIKGKVISVKLPENGGFSVYDQAGICINNTVVSGKDEVVLPENGKIVFAGDAGSKFEVLIK